MKSGSSLGCVTCDNHRTSHNKSYHELYSIWNSMKDRCLNSKHYAFKDYGGRGITVSEEWLNIDNFLKDMGERPKGLSLDRINNDMGYSKENCRWATWKEQSSNKRPRKTKSKLENYE